MSLLKELEKFFSRVDYKHLAPPARLPNRWA